MKRVLVFILSCCFIFGNAHAAIVHSLYQTEVPLASQSKQNVDTAMRAGLQQVIVKVSGDVNAINNAVVRKSLVNARQMAQQFSFEKESVDDSEKPEQMVLKVSFEPTMVNRLLREANLAIWGINRPSILLWLAVRLPDGTTQIINSNMRGKLVKTIRTASYNRGLSIVLPLMDITDMAKVNANDVMQQDVYYFAQVSKRYSANSVLIGRISVIRSGEVTGYWQLLLDNESLEWTISGSDVEDVITKFIDEAANTLAMRYSVWAPGGEDAKQMLVVRDIETLQDIARLRSYLRGLTSVTDIEMVRATKDRVWLEVTLHGSEQSLVQAISQDNVLIPVTDANSDYTSSLKYSFVH